MTVTVSVLLPYKLLYLHNTMVGAATSTRRLPLLSEKKTRPSRDTHTLARRLSEQPEVPSATASSDRRSLLNFGKKR